MDHSPFLYAGACSAEDLGKFASYAEEMKEAEYHDIDRSTFDASVPLELMVLFIDFLREWYDMPEACYEAVMATIESHEGFTTSRIYYKTVGRVVTGWPGTAVFNTLLGMLVQGYVAWKQIGRLPDPTWWRAVGMGDDTVVATTIPYDATLESRCGFKPKINTTRDFDEVGFLSGLFWRVTPYVHQGRMCHRVHGPKVGKQLAKCGWDVTLTRANLSEEQRNIMWGHTLDWSHVPVLCAVRHKILAIVGTFGAKAVTEKDDFHKVKCSVPHGLAEAATLQYMKTAKMPAAVIQEALSEIDAATTLPHCLGPACELLARADL